MSKRVSNAVHMGLWAAVFAVMFATGYIEGDHPGDSIAFWKRAVHEDRHDATRKLVMVAGSKAVASQSPEAYNELGILSLTANVDDSSEETRRKSAGLWFARAAERGSQSASKNLVQQFLFHRVRRSDQDLARALQVVGGLAGAGDRHAAFLNGLVSEVRGDDPRQTLQLYRRCGEDHVHAHKGIARIGLQAGARIDLSRAAVVLAAAEQAGDGEAAFYLAYMHRDGRGVGRDLGARQGAVAAGGRPRLPTGGRARRQGADAALSHTVARRRRRAGMGDVVPRRRVVS